VFAVAGSKGKLWLFLNQSSVHPVNVVSRAQRPAPTKKTKVMKLNKYSLIAAIVLGGVLTTSTLVNAADEKKPAPGEHKRGPGGGPGGEPRKGMGMMGELGLSEDQKAKMEELNKELGPKYKAIMEDSNLAKEDKMAKMKALGDERMAKMKTILTSEQLAKLEKMKGSGPGGAGNGEMRDMRVKMFQELGLSDDQKAKMEALDKEFGPKYKAIYGDSNLSKEDKMAKMKALNDERMAKVKTILTPEQLAKLEKMKGGGQGGPKGGEHKPKKTD
jgi:Spy/CpxP family protein refolding chaperone